MQTPKTTLTASARPEAAQDRQETESLIANHAPEVKNRARYEVAIIRRTIRDLLAQGYSLAVWDGDEVVTGDASTLLSAIMAVDEARLQTTKPGCKNSFVFFVMGNSGHDVISDYGVSIEDALSGAIALSDHFADGADPYSDIQPEASR